MVNSEEILLYSLAVITLISFVLGLFRGGAVAYLSTLRQDEFAFTFDKARLPACLYTISALAVMSFVYGILISQEAHIAAWFCLGATVASGAGCISICFVPKK